MSLAVAFANVKRELYGLTAASQLVGVVVRDRKPVEAIFRFL
jgi:hypothetical protein